MTGIQPYKGEIGNLIGNFTKLEEQFFVCSCLLKLGQNNCALSILYGTPNVAEIVCIPSLRHPIRSTDPTLSHEQPNKTLKTM